MKKVMSLGLAGLAVMCMSVAPAYACGDKTDGASKASAQMVGSGGTCGAKAEKASMASTDSKADKTSLVSSKDGCASKTNASMASTGDKAACTSAHGQKLTAEDCAKMMNMTAEECAKACGYTGEMKLVNMNISGMTCGGCEKSVTTALEKVDGVVKVISVNYSDGSALVCYDPSKVKTDAITTAVANKGYQVEVVPAVATTGTDTKMKVCSPADKAACAAKESKASLTGAEGTK